jgi:hypothetical protein
MHSKSAKRANMTLNSFGKNMEQEVKNPKNSKFAYFLPFTFSGVF